jgi:hypothetical protein
MKSGNMIWIGVAAVLAYLFYTRLKGMVTDDSYSIITPRGGVSITKNPLAGTFNVSATIKKKKKKGKVGKFLGGLLKPAAKMAVGYIPGVGPAAQAALAKW